MLLEGVVFVVEEIVEVGLVFPLSLIFVTVTEVVDFGEDDGLTRLRCFLLCVVELLFTDEGEGVKEVLLLVLAFFLESSFDCDVNDAADPFSGVAVFEFETLRDDNDGDDVLTLFCIPLLVFEEIEERRDTL